MTAARRSQGVVLGVAFALLLAGAGTASAQSRIEDCEKIQAADAYNQCLAKFGPTSKVKNVTPAQPGDIKGSGEEAAAGAAAKGSHARGHRGRVARAHGRASRHVATRSSGKRGKAAGGRKRMTITVKRRH